VAVLGPGSFFGEMALMGNRPRLMSVRARSEVEVLVLGKNVFTQMSSALAPLKDALAQALNRRAVDVWKEQPEVHELLRRTPLRELMEPAPQPWLKPDMTLREVGQAFVDHTNEFFYVSGDGQSLEGVITITDLMRGRSMGLGLSTPASEFMTKNPVVVAADDSAAIAGAAFREYRLKTLPVVEQKGSRKLVGSIRVRRLLAFALKEQGRAETTEPKS
jgi:NADH dehydrogenase